MKSLRNLLWLPVMVAALAFTAAPANAEAVDLELLLLVDVSGSVDASEYTLQKQGYIDAFKDASVISAIQAGALGKIAVSYVEWSGSAQQSQLVGWTLISNGTEGSDFADDIDNATRAFNGLTAVQSALDYGSTLFDNNGFEGTRLVIDISGDGTDNDSPAGLQPTGGRDNALAVVDTINGLVIGGGATLQNYYQNNVIGGPGAFLSVVSDFDDFAVAVKNKLVREITGVPEPGLMALLVVGVAGVGLRRRLRRS